MASFNITGRMITALTTLCVETTGGMCDTTERVKFKHENTTTDAWICGIKSTGRGFDLRPPHRRVAAWASRSRTYLTPLKLRPC